MTTTGDKKLAFALLTFIVIAFSVMLLVLWTSLQLHEEVRNLHCQKIGYQEYVYTLVLTNILRLLYQTSADQPLSKQLLIRIRQFTLP